MNNFLMLLVVDLVLSILMRTIATFEVHDSVQYVPLVLDELVGIYKQTW